MYVCYNTEAVDRAGPVYFVVRGYKGDVPKYIIDPSLVEKL